MLNGMHERVSQVIFAAFFYEIYETRRMHAAQHGCVVRIKIG